MTAKPVAKPLTKERADELLQQVIDSPPDGDPQWQRPQHVAWRKTKQLLPADVDRGLLHRALVASAEVGGWGDVDEMPADLDDAVIRLGEHFEKAQPEWAFIMVAFRVGKPKPALRHDRLVRLLGHEHWLRWAGRTTRKKIAELLDDEPELVDAARAAFAMDEDRYTSRFLPILAVDGSPDSLDLLLPMFEAARTSGDNVDWIREDVVPLLPDTKACRAFVDDFTAVVDKRTDASPARAFLVELGQAKPPKIVKFNLAFKDAADKPTYSVKADSTSQHWLFGRRNVKWQWRGVEPNALEIPPETRRYHLQVGAGVDRDVVDRWARTLTKKTKR